MENVDKNIGRITPKLHAHLQTMWNKYAQFKNGKLWDELCPQGIYHHSADYISFENGVLPMYTLEGVSSDANFINAYEESPQ